MHTNDVCDTNIVRACLYVIYLGRAHVILLMFIFQSKKIKVSVLSLQ